ncbi:LacI family DNA-binding transcriptional regulator [Gynuella sp.]|uniref:LacI family DNA-binding transcriptional regulator n=1 Tax=Gynuella sp. TaxID=2969146 RepID=UPI003D12829A
MKATNKLTLKEVARTLGVSRTTVSNAYNRPDQLSAELREYIFQHAAEIGYHGPNPAGRLLRTGKTDAIGLIFYDRFSSVFEDEQAVELIRGITSVLEKNGTSLVMIPTMSTKQETNNTLSALVDGFIIFSGYHDENSPFLPILKSRGLPAVSIDHKYDGLPSVGINDYSAARLVASKVIESGHTDVIVMSLALARDHYRGFISAQRYLDKPESTAVNRIYGYMEIFDAYSNVNVDIFETSETDLTSDNLVNIAEQMLREKPNVTAIVCMSDFMAEAVIRAAKNLHKRVPEQLSIVGFDGIRSGQLMKNPLTTIRQPMFEKGRKVARMMLGFEVAKDRKLEFDWLEGATLSKRN